MAVGELAGGGHAGPCDGGDYGPGGRTGCDAGRPGGPGGPWRPMGKVVEEAIGAGVSVTTALSMT
jgi:hypothetical protein